MAISYVNESHSSTAGATSLTWSFTPSAGVNLLVVGVAYKGTSNVTTGATYNGVAMTRVGAGVTNNQSSGVTCEQFYLLAPPTGAHNVVVSLSASREIQGNAIGLSSARYTSPVDDSVSATFSNPTAQNPLVDGTTTGVNSLVVDILGTTASGPNTTLTAGQTKIWGNYTSIEGDTSYLPRTVAGAYQMKWSCANAYNALLAVSYLDGTIPTVTTQAVSTSDTTGFPVIGNGNITALGQVLDAPTERGFVYDLSSHADPGNVAPASTSYALVATETGTFSTGAFTGRIFNMANGTKYYLRAYVRSANGYSYGGEVNFTTNYQISFMGSD